MAKIMIAILLCSSSFAAQAAERNEILRYNLFSSLMDIGEKPLAKFAHCNLSTGQKGTLTIRKWVAWNLSFMRPESTNSIAADCKELKPSTASCIIDFKVGGKDRDPWDCGFKFDVSLPSYKIDLKTLNCTGSC